MTLTSIPAQLVAGDTLLVELDVGDYPASGGWAVTLALVSLTGGTPVIVNATGGETAWTVLLTAAASEALAAGKHRYHIAASKTARRETISIGELLVLPNPTATGVDQRSPAQIALDAIDAVLANRATSADLKFEFEDGRSIEKIPHGELIGLRNFYARQVANQKRSVRGPGRVQMRL